MIQEAPTGLRLYLSEETFNYMYNVVEKVYGLVYSPRTNSKMKKDINLHVEAFLEIILG